MTHSSLTEYFESRGDCEELLGKSRLQLGAEVKDRESKLLFLNKFVEPALATMWLH